jgi:hypothetical protein
MFKEIREKCVDSVKGLMPEEKIEDSFITSAHKKAARYL